MTRRHLAVFLVGLVTVAVATGLTAVVPDGGGSGNTAPRLTIVYRPHGVSISTFGTVGAPVVGEVFASDNGHWSKSVSGYSYQWQGCTGISGTFGTSCTNASGSPSTSNAYTVNAGDVGDYLQVVVTATFVSGGSASQTSPATGQVSSGGGVAPVNTVAPYFCGVGEAGCSGTTQTAVSGNVISVGQGTWTCAGGCGSLTYAYQWFTCTTTAGQPPTTASCSSLGASNGAQTNSYTIQAGDSTHSLTPVVTASNNGTAGTPTTSSGSTCNKGSIPANANTQGITTFTDTEPQLYAGCSPISAVVGASASALRFCTNAPTTCGFADPLNQTAGVPAGTSVSTVGSLTCNGGNPNPTNLNVTGSVSVSAGCASISNSFLPTVDDSGIVVTYSHDDILGSHTGSWWNYHCTFTPGDEQPGGGADIALYGGGGASNALHVNDSFIHCSSESLNGFWATADHNYIISDECWGICGESNHTCRYNSSLQCGTTHNEAVYEFGGQPTWTVTNSVLYNSYPQTAGIFADGSTGGQSNATITGNLFAYTGTSNGALILGSCTVGTNTGNTVTGNRFSFAFGASMPIGGAQASGVTWSSNLQDGSGAAVTNPC